MKATIIEQGNGLPAVGDRVWDPDSGDVYRVASRGRIQTDRCDGNYFEARIRLCGSVHGMSDRVFARLSDCKVELGGAA